MRELVGQVLASRRMRVGLGLIGVLCAVAILAPLVTSYDPSDQIDLATRQLLAPSLLHPFGTDFFSRDLLTRVLHGARISLSVAVLSVVVSVMLGTIVGLVAGSAGRALDTVLMRLVDTALAIPRLFLLIVVLTLWRDVGLAGLVAILGLTSWFHIARIVRAEVLSLRAREFVSASRVLGLTPQRIAVRHLLPNLVAPIIVAATLGVGQIVLLEAGLSYLGIGVSPPTPSWGAMIAEGQQLMSSAWWVAAFPGMAIVLTVLGFSLAGDGLRDALDPRTR
jgi:peptide/nickel transport system permease protein